MDKACKLNVMHARARGTLAVEQALSRPIPLQQSDHQQSGLQGISEESQVLLKD